MSTKTAKSNKPQQATKDVFAVNSRGYLDLVMGEESAVIAAWREARGAVPGTPEWGISIWVDRTAPREGEIRTVPRSFVVPVQ